MIGLLLQDLSSADNAARGAAEVQLEAWKGRDIGDLVGQLLAAARASDSFPIEARSLSAIVLRRTLVDGGGYDLISGDAAKAALRDELAASLAHEADAKIKGYLCDIVGKLAATAVNDVGEWPQVLPLANQLIQSADAVARESGLTLLEWLVQGSAYLQVLVSEANVAALVQALRSGLADTSREGRVMLAAARALYWLLSKTRSEAHVDLFQELVADAAAAMQMLIAGGSTVESVSRDFVGCLIDVALVKASFFGAAQLAPLLSLLLQLVHAEATSDDNRGQLIELFVTLCECLPKEARRLRASASDAGFVVTSFLPAMAALMTRIPDAAAAMSDAGEPGDGDADDDDDYIGECESIDPLVSTAEDAYDRVCQALGMRATFPHVMEQLKALLGGEAGAPWQHRYAGTLILANYLDLSVDLGKRNEAEAARHQVLVVAQLARYAADSVPRVRYGAFYGATQLLVKQGHQLSEVQLGALLAVIVAGVSAEINPSSRVRRYALMALISILELLPEHLMEVHASGILDTTVAALAAGPLSVQEKSVAVVLTLVRCVKRERVAALYDAMAPVLRQLLAYAHSNSLLPLWGQALDCLAAVGEASGPAKFHVDALDLMHTLARMHETLPPEAEVQAYLLRVWVRIAPCLGANFLPFLPLVVGKIMQALAADITAGTGDVDLDDPSLEDRPGIQVLETDDGYLVVRTSACEDQVAGCCLLLSLVRGVQEGFYPYLEQATCALVPLLKSPHSDVRCGALEAVPELMRAVAQGGDRASLLQFFAYALAQVVEQTRREAVVDFTMLGLEGLRKMLLYACTDWAAHALGAYEFDSKAGLPVLTPATSLAILSREQMLALSECGMAVLHASIQERAVLRAEAQVSGRDDDDQDADDDLARESLEVYHSLGEMLSAALCTHGALFLPVYQEQWHAIVIELVQPCCLREDRVLACSLVCDVVMYGLPPGDDDAATVAAFFLGVMDPLVDCCASGGAECAELRRMAAFTVGMAAERFSCCFSPYAPIALAALHRCINIGDRGGGERGNASDNAVSSVGTILHASDCVLLGPAGYDTQALWGQWLGYLPLRHDTDEGRKVAKQLCALLGQRHANLFLSPERVAQAVAVLAAVCLDTALTSEALSGLIQHTLQGLAAAQGEHQWQQMKATLAPDLAACVSQLVR